MQNRYYVRGKRNILDLIKHDKDLSCPKFRQLLHDVINGSISNMAYVTPNEIKRCARNKGVPDSVIADLIELHKESQTTANNKRRRIFPENPRRQPSISNTIPESNKTPPPTLPRSSNQGAREKAPPSRSRQENNGSSDGSSYGSSDGSSDEGLEPIHLYLQVTFA